MEIVFCESVKEGVGFGILFFVSGSTLSPFGEKARRLLLKSPPAFLKSWRAFDQSTAVDLNLTAVNGGIHQGEMKNAKIRMGFFRGSIDINDKGRHIYQQKKLPLMGQLF